MQYYYLIAAIIASYFIGSIPTAYIFGRVLKGIDIRKFGSGNVGATNALRVLGKKAGISVLIIDMLKGLIPVVLLGKLITGLSPKINAELIYIVIGVTCILGHNWTVFLSFKGGKGMATTLGVLLGLSLVLPGLKIIFGLIILAWIIVFTATRIVSAASVISAITLPILTICFKKSALLIALSIILSSLIILRHKANIARLLQGKEPRISLK